MATSEGKLVRRYARILVPKSGVIIVIFVSAAALDVGFALGERRVVLNSC